MNTANNLIYIITSTLLGFMLISGIVGKTNLEAVRVSISLPEEVYADTAVPVVVRVHNRRSFIPVFLVSVSVKSEEVFFHYLDAKSEISRTVSVRFERRGMSPPIPVFVASRFPFGFFIRTRVVPPVAPVVVFPKLLPCHSPLKPPQRHSKGDERPMDNRVGEEHDLRSIREYQLGDPLKKIHWKSSARTGRWLTKEFSVAAQEALVVNLEQIWGKDLESTLSCAAFLITAAVRRGRAVGLIAGGRTYPPEATIPHKRKLLKVLAFYGEN